MLSIIFAEKKHTFKDTEIENFQYQSKMSTKSYDLSTFQLDRILSNNSKSKTICVLGTFPSQQSADSTEPAIVVFEKTAFTEDDVNTLHDKHDDDELNTKPRRYFSLETQLKQEFINDIYGNFQCFPIPAINSNCHHLFFRIIFFSFIIVHFRENKNIWKHKI